MASPADSGVRLLPLGVPHDDAFGPTRTWCSWDRMYGREYLIPTLTVFSQDCVAAIARVAEAAHRIYSKIVRYVQDQVPDDYLVHQLGIPEPLCAVIRQHVPFDGITRFDLALDHGHIRILEYNADTPTGVVETAYVAGSVISRFTSLVNPSAGMDVAIRRALARLVAHYRGTGFTGPLVYSAAGDHEEDAGTVAYTRHVAGLASRFVPLQDLRVDAGSLLASGERVGIWYRLYPWEHLPLDRDTDGFPTGQHIITLIAEGRLASISPPQAIIAQSKGLQALIWELAELKHPVFDEGERQFIRSHFLPSYWEPDRFRSRGEPFVSKPFFGREGGGVTLYDGTGRVEEQDAEPHYWDQPMLYQQRVELPEVCLDTEGGPVNGRLLVGAFVIGGVFAGILPRIGGAITGNLAYFTPAAMERQ